MAQAVPRRTAAGMKAASRAAPRKAAAKSVAKAASAKQTAAASAKHPDAERPAAKRPAAKRPAAKRVTAKSAPAKRAPAKAVARAGRPTAATRKLTALVGPQRFTVSHLREADFKTAGLRPYAKYRELGVAAATGGLCQAHVIRLLSPCTDEVRKRHKHDVELQLIYVLRGWVKNEFEGHGEQMMSQGSCWIQPPGMRHTVLDYSVDCELLEIVVPADFKTAEI